MKKIVASIFALLLLVNSLSLFACSKSSTSSAGSSSSAVSTPSGEATVPGVVDLSLSEAKTILKNAGFSNIYDIPDETSDSFVILDDSNWVVLKQSPEANSLEMNDTEITLYCIKYSEREAAAQNAETEKFKALIGGPLANAVSLFAENGYTPKYMHATTHADFTSEVSFMDDAFMSEWIVTDIQAIDPVSKTAEVYINNQNNIARLNAANSARDALSKKLDKYNAQEAVNRYAQSQFPYGFKAHWIIGLITDDAIDENTWFFKVSCDVTNMYGAKQKDLICEAYVTGTDENPVVTSFNVY